MIYISNYISFLQTTFFFCVFLQSAFVAHSCNDNVAISGSSWQVLQPLGT